MDLDLFAFYADVTNYLWLFAVMATELQGPDYWRTLEMFPSQILS